MLDGLARQRAILDTRRGLLDGVPESDRPMRDRIDANTLKQLKEVSPAGLKPLLFKRNHQEWTPGFLVELVGDGGKRILVFADTWRLVRAKKHAWIVLVPLARCEDHVRLVQLYQGYQIAFNGLLCEVCRKKKKPRKAAN